MYLSTWRLFKEAHKPSQKETNYGTSRMRQYQLGGSGMYNNW
jgi:hypothetical protein